MANRKEALALVLKELGFESNAIKDSFQKRFRIQKYIYLLQEWKGYNWRYGYNVYMSGPYSPSLTEDVYQIINENLISDVNGKLSDDFKSDLSEVKIVEDDELMEALTTLFYIAKSFRWATRTMSKPEALSKLEEYSKSRFHTVKPFIDDTVMNKAWNIIQKKNMLDPWLS